MLLLVSAAQAQIRIVAVGDSSFAGGSRMTSPQDTYPARLEAALRAKGHNVTVANAGINGEMAWQTLDRLNIAVPNGTHIAIVCTGVNDLVLQYAPRSRVLGRLKDIVSSLRARGIRVVIFSLGGPGTTREQVTEEMEVLRGLGALPVPPMQSGGLVERKDLHLEREWQPQTTNWHLNREGNDIVVQRTLPAIEAVIARLQ